MATHLKNLSTHDTEKVPDGEGFIIGIVVSEYNSDITFALRDGCLKTLLDNGVLRDNIVIDYVPGAFELPLGAQTLYLGKECDAIITLGCVIKGDTDHDIYINQSVANAIAHLNIEHDTPFIFGLLTTNNLEQAQDRAGGKHGNKGVECAVAALKMLALQEKYYDEEDNSYLN
jgi:6,7-dimethyl-8-ribityllumazine synthase